MSQEVCGYAIVFGELATDGRAEYSTALTFREFLAKPHRVPLTLNHDGRILADAIELHADSCGLSFRAQIGTGAWSLLAPKMLGEGYTLCSIGFVDPERKQRTCRGRYIFEVMRAGIDHVACVNRAAWPQTGCWPHDYAIEDHQLAQLRYRFVCAERNRLRDQRRARECWFAARQQPLC